MLDTITPVILTFNEAPNLDRTLRQLAWADRIIVVDSYSTDATLDILKRYPQVEVFQRPFHTHADQWNFGLQQVESDWVLSLDADYRLSNELIAEMDRLDPEAAIAGYFIPFKYCVFGKPLRGTLLPPRAALFQRFRATYIDDGHTQLLQVNGDCATLQAPIYHDDRKPLSRWLWAQDRYSLLEVQKLQSTPTEALSLGDRLRRNKVVAPFVILVYCLLVHRGILDGPAGWYYAFQRVLAEILLSIRLIEAEQQGMEG
ncbi:glycosyl transferase [Leptolyngbya sp. 'hensonii']|uniref:glycosyltransferase family 2 protein n=1 Tax=Leptolyngbya sp. 'hensonii' TaxID=1922337 RepID=UPI00094FE0AA|nr:glycosyltransferase family 2 protein [Leptolyngbya sp. 'hensonii']OLP18910.1 glycosyl transferase [Leptolyngbya sp. 'hensonii']